jgi:lipoate synthase
VDSRIESYYDLPGLSTTSMVIEGSVTVTVSVDDTTEDGAREYVDTDAIISAMDSSAEVEVLDWEIDSVNAV